MTKKFGAGSDIDSKCGKCGMELAHVIIAMDGVRPAMVQCKTCQSKHKYRGDVGKPQKKKAVRKRVGHAVVTLRGGKKWVFGHADRCVHKARQRLGKK